MSMMQKVDDWQVRAACRGPQGTAVFFPPSNFERKDEKEDRESRAKAICRGCLVQKACLEYAIAIKELHGIWGGTNEVERKHLLTQRSA